jgi:hypothetical protein
MFFGPVSNEILMDEIEKESSNKNILKKIEIKRIRIKYDIK